MHSHDTETHPIKTLLATALLACATVMLPVTTFATPSNATPSNTTPASAANVATHATQTDPVAIANALLDDMDAGHFDAAHARFDAKMAAALDVAKLKDVWVSVGQQFGKLHTRGAASSQSVQGMTVVSIALHCERGELLAQVATDADGKIAGFFIKPAPPPATSRADLPSREIHFAPAGRSKLPGTVLLPAAGKAGKGPFPAMVFVHGSGPNDRDESVGGTRVFLDLAQGLAERGIASLRYDKRTKVHPDEFRGAFTIDDETTDDAIAAVAFLRKQPDIDPQRIYVVGHSQGAMMAPRIAQKVGTEVKGIVLLAAPSRHLEDILVDQNEYMAHANGKPDAATEKQLIALKDAVAAVKKIDAHTPAMQKFLLDLPASYWRSLSGYDDVAVARAIKQPMLILQGQRDFQVTAPDWQRWHAAFDHDPRVTFKDYPALNHLFVAGTGPGSIAEYSKPAHVDAKVVADIADWIAAH
ncbi:MAG: alpha/beta fold hydrolase [Proteobacteria bacterium]|nr:alpha/beta fold hydrolase [Pseudomonadota bacterium]